MEKIITIIILLYSFLYSNIMALDCDHDDHVEMGTYGGDAMSDVNWSLLGVCKVVGNELYLADTEDITTYGVAWYPDILNVVHGFDVRFSILLDGNDPEGFAFVVHRSSDGILSFGQGGYYLGYTDMNRALSFEFDFHQTNALGDPSDAHLSIHYNGNSPNSADESFNILDSPITFDANDFNDGSWHQVRIRYEFADGGDASGRIRVYISDNGMNFDSDWINDKLTQADWLAGVRGDCRMGWTSGQTVGKSGLVKIRGAEFQLVESSTQLSAVDQCQTSLVAGQLNSDCRLKIQSKCEAGDGNIAYLPFSSSVQGFLVTNPNVEPTSSHVGTYIKTNRNNGAAKEYTFDISMTEVNHLQRTYYLFVRVQFWRDSQWRWIGGNDNNPDDWQGNYIAIDLYPDVTDAKQTEIIWPVVAEYVAGQVYTFDIQAKDQFGNIRETGGEEANFDISFELGTIKADMTIGYSTLGLYQLSWNATVAGSYVGYLTYNFIHIGLESHTLNSPIEGTVNIVPASADASTSAIEGLGLYYGVAGEEQDFTVTIFDRFTNPITTQGSNTLTATIKTASNVDIASTVEWDVDKFVVKYTPTVEAGLYSIVLDISGTTSQTYTPSIAPGPEDPVMSSVTRDFSTTIEAGTQISFTIVARDAYGNVRTSSNSINDFTLRSNPSVNVALVQPFYQTGGAYTALFTPEPATSYTITFEHEAANGTVIEVDEVTITVTPASPSHLYSQVTVQGSNAVVGQVSTMTIEARDAFNNAITDGSDANSFDVTMVSVNSEVGFIEARRYISGNQYQIDVNATIAATYNIKVTVAGSNVAIVTGEFQVVYSPDNAHGPNCKISGIGIYGGVKSLATQFSIEARDRFDNRINPDITTFSVVMNETLPQPTAIAYQGSGLYEVTYYVPESPGPFTIDVTISSTSASPIVGSYQAFSQLDSSESFAVVIEGTGETGLTGAIVGEQSQFTIVDQEEGPCPCNGIPGTRFFRVTFTKYDDDVTESSPLVEFQGSVDAKEAEPTDELYTVTYTPQLDGYYRIRVFLEGVETDQSATTKIFVSVEVGPPNALMSLIEEFETVTNAGVQNNIRVKLRDAQGNDIKNGSSVTGVALAMTYTTFGITNPQPIDETAIIDYDNGTYTWKYTAFTSSTTSRYEFTIRLDGVIIPSQVNVLVLPGTYNATMSELTSIPDTLVAGVVMELYLQVMDTYGNKIVNTPSLASDIDVTLSSNTLSTKNVQSLAENLFLVYFVPTVTGTWSGYTVNSLELSVTINGGAVNGLPKMVKTLPDVLSEGISSIDIYPITVIANETINTNVNLFDVNNNVWYFEFSPFPFQKLDVQLFDGSRTYPIAHTTVAAGVFNVEFELTKVGDYEVQILIENLPRAISGIHNIQVTPTVTDPLQSSYSWGSTEIRASELVSVVLQTRDTFGNEKVTSTDQVKLVAYSSDCTEEFTAEAWVGGYQPTTLLDAFQNNGAEFVYQVTPNGDGTYTIQFTGAVVGIYKIDFAIGGGEVLSQTQCSGRRNFEIGYHDIHGPNTVFGKLSAEEQSLGDVDLSQSITLEAGKPVTMELFPRDVFGNNIDVIPDGTTFTVGENATVDYNQTIHAFQPWLMNDSDSFVAVDTQVNKWVVTLKSNISNVYYLILVVDDLIIPVNHNRFNVVVEPSYIYNFSVPEFLHGDNVFASYPDGFNITAVDVFGNDVKGDILDKFSITFNRIDNDVEYGFNALQTSYPFQFLSHWAGEFQVTVLGKREDGQEVATQSRISRVIFKPLLCGIAAPFRCDTGNIFSSTCVASYDLCPGFNSTASSFCDAQCNCPGIGVQLFKCEAGHCVNDLADCPVVPSSCPVLLSSNQDLERCSSGCRSGSSNDCPAQTLCVDPLKKCPDGVSCATQIEDCPTFATLVAQSTCPNNTVQCYDGRCAGSFADCPTLVSCSSGKIRCSDGSCKDSHLQCPNQYECVQYGDTQSLTFRCSDGSCRESLADCPTGTTCPVGLVLCESKRCANTVAECTNTQCAYDTVRCPDGTCRPNGLLCSSGITCKSDEVLCEDNTCAQSVDFCRRLPQCKQGMVPCPDGSCSSSFDRCPSFPTCTGSTPVLCSDFTCRGGVDECPTGRSCQGTKPFRCSDGSCVRSYSHCPNLVPCPEDKPVRCHDNKCVVASDYCLTNNGGCASNGTMRCPDGSCSSSINNCPTAVSCPPGSERCLDGSCSASCTTDVIKTCSSDQVSCPQPYGGLSCAAKLEECPQAAKCPTSKPIRCIDQSCAVAVEECPNPTLLGVQVLCPSGNYVSNIKQCGTLATCPEHYPFKCLDGTCKVSPDDCPKQKECAQGEVLCPGGQCSTGLSCAQLPRCTIAQPLRCWNGAQCNTNLGECDEQFDETKTNLVTECPYGFTRCRDGACRISQSHCNPVTCPKAFSVLCRDGSCATETANCPTNETNTLCGSDEERCADGRCVKIEESSNCNQVRQASTTANYCPFYRPFKCADGQCAISSVYCPIVPSRVGEESLCDLNSSKPIYCADGSCQETGLNCPIVLPCYDQGLSPRFRCDDGACVVLQSMCTPHNSHPNITRCPDARPVRCRRSGVCARNAVECFDAQKLVKEGDIVTSRKCPETMTECSNGLCMPSGSCNITGPINGCPSDKATKCWNGECVASMDLCPLTNNCPSTLPHLCGNGICVDDVASCTSTPCSHGRLCADGICRPHGTCKTRQGCPITDPIRCADGTCKKFKANLDMSPFVSENSCKPVVSCNSEQVLCADGTCKNNYGECRPILACSGTNTYCPYSGSCLSTADCSAAQKSDCPASNPVLCGDGQCVDSVTSCSSMLDFAGYGSVADASCASPLQACFDGSCVSSLKDCIDWRVQLTTECPVNTTMCSDGSCVFDVSYCTPIEPCGSDYPMRCSDGSCTNQACPVSFFAECTAGTTRCADGACHEVCPATFGCFGATPYKCAASKGCTANAQECTAIRVNQDNIVEDTVSVYNITNELIPVCIADQCKSEIEAVRLYHTLDNSKSHVINIAVDKDGVVRTKIEITSGSLQVQLSTVPVLTITPVSPDVLKQSFGKVLASRPEYRGTGEVGILEGKELLLSPAFQCNLMNAGMLHDFKLTSYIDISTTLNVKAFQKVNAEDPDDKTHPYQEICLASLSPNGQWICLLPSYAERIAEENQLYDQQMNRHDVVSSYIDAESCKETTLAFVRIPSPLKPFPPTPELCWWCDNKYYVIFIGIGVLLLGLLIFIVIRYLRNVQKDYYNKREEHDELEDRLADLDINAGGFGVGGDEIVMVANPLIVKIEKLNKRKDAVEEELRREDDKEQDEMNELEKQFQGLKQELLVLKQTLEFEKQQNAIEEKKNVVIGNNFAVNNDGDDSKQDNKFNFKPSKMKKKKIV